MKKIIEKRKNKLYTSIILKEVSIEAFKEAKLLSQEITGNYVFKISKSAMFDFLKLHSLSLFDVKKGDKYHILGTTYKIIRNKDLNKKEWWPVVEYINPITSQTERFGILQSENLANGVLETSFKNYTGELLGF